MRKFASFWLNVVELPNFVGRHYKITVVLYCKLSGFEGMCQLGSKGGYLVEGERWALGKTL